MVCVFCKQLSNMPNTIFYASVYIFYRIMDKKRDQFEEFSN